MLIGVMIANVDRKNVGMLIEELKLQSKNVDRKKTN